tara:strand:+ start:134 stop:496 length:363 start_codon:yes stop_codon:yes gene_type:complete
MDALAKAMGIKDNQITAVEKKKSTKTIDEPVEIATIRKNTTSTMNKGSEEVTFDCYKQVKPKGWKEGDVPKYKKLRGVNIKNAQVTEDTETGLITIHHFQLFKTEYTTDKESLEYMTIVE